MWIVTFQEIRLGYGWTNHHNVLSPEGHLRICARAHTHTPGVEIFGSQNVSKLAIMTLWDALPNFFLSVLYFCWAGSSPAGDHTLCYGIHPLWQTTYFYALLSSWAEAGFASTVWTFLWEFFGYKIILGYGYLLIPHRYFLVFPAIIIRAITMTSGFGLIYSLKLICR